MMRETSRQSSDNEINKQKEPNFSVKDRQGQTKAQFTVLTLTLS